MNRILFARIPERLIDRAKQIPSFVVPRPPKISRELFKSGELGWQIGDHFEGVREFRVLHRLVRIRGIKTDCRLKERLHSCAPLCEDVDLGNVAVFPFTLILTPRIPSASLNTKAGR